MQGSLYTRDFLLEGITDTPSWKALSEDEVQRFREQVRHIFADFPVEGTPNEHQTEDDLIFPVLEALGWEHYLRQQTAGRRREDVPDALLFPTGEAKAEANKEKSGPPRYRHGIAIVESKTWDLPLDRGAPDLFNQNAPSTQMLRYLSRVEIESERAIQWGILTNGRHWRLYFQGARSRSEEFLELDLPILVGAPGVQPDLFSPDENERAHLLKVFMLMFRRAAFTPAPDDARTFHQQALALTREWEARVSDELSNTVFEKVFPRLVRALAKADPAAPPTPDAAYLDEVRRAALTLLYRLLFVLYAEDRNLLPAHDKGYDDYYLRKIRHDLLNRFDRGDTFSTKASNVWNHLRTAFALVNAGDSGIGLPPYNGGLFNAEHHPLLERVVLPDAKIAPIIDRLSRRLEGGKRKWINYRDLSVQHLGGIYERLLERTVVYEDGRIEIRLTPFARKGSGGYYTHEDLVHLILERTITPLVEERIAAFEDRTAALASERRPKADRIRELAPFDPASRILELKICDPAMGSGHFLVSLVDFLADAILEAMDTATTAVTWADKDKPYVSPLAARIAEIRTRILESAAREGWAVDPSRLDDRHIVRRMILKRVVYGVDKNPMAVELAKVALWLHTFTVGAPLSFLDHHLRCGDSLFGEWVGSAMTEKRGALLINRHIQKAKAAAAGMMRVEEATDADIAEVNSSSETFAGVNNDTSGLIAYLNFIHALRWLGEEADRSLVDELLDGQYGDIVRLVSDGLPAARNHEPSQAALFGNEPRQLDLVSTPDIPREVRQKIESLLASVKALSHQEQFLHWEVAFPGVWSNWESLNPAGGFDAIIGNPPWDRVELQEVEWFATRRREIAMAQRAADRKQMIAALEKADDPLWHEYVLAKERAERAASVARRSGQYPLLSGGDVNIYSLFVERAQRLIKPQGIVGLLVPSGIASDLSASRFFRIVASDGRISALLDFENRWPTYFPDVDSRFIFSVFVVGGSKRRFAKTVCAFFLNGMNELESRSFTLTGDDFSRVNPNTGTAPVFRTRRDADIVRGIYERLPVLVRHTSGGNRSVWPVDYVRMFDMTNDSALFKTRVELEKAGFYPVANRLKRNTSEFVPLYVGKMVYQFDHRSSSVAVNEDALHVAASSDVTTLEEHQNPNHMVRPQYWVDVAEVQSRWDGELRWSLAFRDIARATDARTAIAAIVPFSAAGNTLPLIRPILPSRPADNAPASVIEKWKANVKEAESKCIGWAPLLLANLNSFVLDYVTRQKVQSTHLNWYIVEQLPVVPERALSGKLGQIVINDLIRDHVLRLTYTSHDLAPFARDMGYEGKLFWWDEEERRHLRARLDALYFHLYGIVPEDAAYILDTFPIVREQDEAAFGRYRTKDLILAYMSALAAGDVKSRVNA